MTTAQYSGEEPMVRAHVALRRLSCPFHHVLAELPHGPRMLDYGCGHGLLTAMAASRVGARALGVDIDPRKVAVARRAVAGPGTGFEVITAGEVPAGPWDAIAVVDVLYLLPRDEQRALVMRLAAELSNDGVIVIKEMDEGVLLKRWLLHAQERFMVHVLRATSGRVLAYTDPEDLASALRDVGLEVVSRRIDRGYPYPHHLLVGRRPM